MTRASLIQPPTQRSVTECQAELVPRKYIRPQLFFPRRETYEAKGLGD